MNKKLYALVTLALGALSTSHVAASPALHGAGYHAYDAVALVLGDPNQAYACGYGNPWNTFSYCLLAMLILAGVFVYSNSYAYPSGFRVMAMLRFGSERNYWRRTLIRNALHVGLAALVLTLGALGFGALSALRSGGGAAQFADTGPVDYLLFGCKLAAYLSLLSVFCEVFARRLSRAALIGGIVVCTVLLFSVDVLQKQTALLALGSAGKQGAALAVYLILIGALLLYGRRRPLRI